MVLAAEFPAHTHELWMEGVEKVLAKGKDLSPEELQARFERELMTVTYDGITINPIYSRNDVPATDIGVPGQAPYIRGGRAQGGVEFGWDVRQPVVLDRDDAGELNVIVMEELERGANSLLLRRPTSGASPTVTAEFLDKVLDSVFLDMVPIVWESPSAADVDALLGLWGRREMDPAAAQGTLGLDPIGAPFSGPESELDLAQIAALITRCRQDHPGVKVLAIDGTRFHNAGASDVEELAAVAAVAVATIRAVTAAGVAVRDALASIELRFAATADQFSTIAKFRAARRMWARVAEHLGAADVPPTMHALMSQAMMTRYDPWVNLLRGTVAAMAAGVGGADSVTVEAYDALLHSGTASTLGRRMARNTQALLIDESHLARVLDPAGGSNYIETLTDAMANHAWDWFRAIEAAGGADQDAGRQLIIDRIEQTWAQRANNIATRRDPITGVSEFPNIDEVIPAAGDASASAGLLPIRRYAEAFEDLRQRCDRHLADTGSRPVVVLANLGTAADFTARTTFAKNFFEAGGLATVAWSPGSELPEAAMACLCSSDARYDTDAAEAAATLRSGGITSLYLAGRWGQGDATGEVVDEYVYAGCNALSILQDALDRAGVK